MCRLQGYDMLDRKLIHVKHQARTQGPALDYQAAMELRKEQRFRNVLEKKEKLYLTYFCSS